jgi:flagellar biosynthesis/type III secretory pathway M-ring protein FliF/YscJ
VKAIIIKMMVAAVAMMSMIVTAIRRPRMATVLSELSRVVGDEIITVITGAAIRSINYMV